MTRLFTIHLLLLAGVIAFSQDHPMLTDSAHHLSAGILADAYPGFTAGYSKRLAWRSRHQGGIIIGEIQLPFSYLTKDHKDHTFKACTAYRYGYIHNGGFSLIGDLGSCFLQHSQPTGNFASLGVEIKLTPGFQLGKYNVGLYYHWLNVLCTHITCSGDAKEGAEGKVSPDLKDSAPMDGWQMGKGSKFSYGLSCYTQLSVKTILCIDLGVTVYQETITGMNDLITIGPQPVSVSAKIIYKLSDSF
jgi:hypothetical protein